MFHAIITTMNTNPRAKTVVCYGDSNTWGAVPLSNDRYPADVRWVGVLQNILGPDYEVVNEGLCGRTLVAVDPDKPHRTGITHLKSILETNDPIDIIIIMLGTNDMKVRYELSAVDIAGHLQQTIEFIQKETVGADGQQPQILVIYPPFVVKPQNRELDVRMKNAVATSHELEPLYREMASKFDCLYLNSADFISLENTDGYHLAAKDHKLLGERVAKIIQQL